ncbi:hypothetical protein ACIBKY_12945 [Nonomuraea sp. NPDC050394]|uniref:hypothetical protein n=1 Tax=Nonomuraea sp. NPDC050394 TaxID=3364363 RepID=UPI0037AAECED
MQIETRDEQKAKAPFEQKRRAADTDRDGDHARLRHAGPVRPGDGNTIILTPRHTTEHPFGVPRDLITQQAGLQGRRAA